MRTYLITGAAVLLLATPALAQTMTRETTTTYQSAPEPILAPPPPAPFAELPPPPLAGTTYESRSTTQYGGSAMQYGDGGYGQTTTRTDRYIGTDGALHTDTVIDRR